MTNRIFSIMHDATSIHSLPIGLIRLSFDGYQSVFSVIPSLFRGRVAVS